jgi:hypothetical protein
MYFTDIDHGFCESMGEELPYPEITNFYSSFFISFIGLIGLYLNFSSKLKSKLVGMIYGLFFINGIGAAGFHYNQQKGWGVIDELSMMIAVSLGSLYLYIMLFKTVKIRYNNYLINIIFSILCVGYLIFGFSLSLFDDTRDYFPIIFTVPTLSLLPPLYYINNKYYNDDVSNASLMLKKGVSFSLVTAIIWGVSENLCIHYSFIKYLYLHSVWHVGFSYGMFLICEFCCHFQMYLIYNKKFKIRFYYGIPFRTDEEVKII